MQEINVGDYVKVITVDNKQYEAVILEVYKCNGTLSKGSFLCKLATLDDAILCSKNERLGISDDRCHFEFIEDCKEIIKI